MLVQLAGTFIPMQCVQRLAGQTAEVYAHG